MYSYMFISKPCMIHCQIFMEHFHRHASKCFQNINCYFWYNIMREVLLVVPLTYKETEAQWGTFGEIKFLTPLPYHNYYNLYLYPLAFVYTSTLTVPLIFLISSSVCQKSELPLFSETFLDNLRRNLGRKGLNREHQ